MIYEVKKGENYFKPRALWFETADSIEMEVMFLPSCIYETKQNQNQGDWNKLFGISSLFGRKALSYRFVWRCNIDLIEIGAYWYQNNVRGDIHIGCVKIGARIALKLSKNANSVQWFIDGQEKHSILGKWPVLGWKLRPYFGGDESAPKNMKLFMQRIK